MQLSQSVKTDCMLLLNSEMGAFLWAFASRVPAFLDFSFPFHVPAFHNAIVFAFPRAPAFLFRVPMLPQFTHKALSGAQLPVNLRYNGGGGGRYGQFSSEYHHLGVLPGGGRGHRVCHLFTGMRIQRFYIYYIIDSSRFVMHYLEIKKLF